jgi:hypothetical protein
MSNKHSLLFNIVIKTNNLSCCKRHLLLTLTLIGLFSCQKSAEPIPLYPSTLSSEKSITAFSFTTAENPNLTALVNGVITNDSIRVIFPRGTVLTNLKPTISYIGKTISPGIGTSQNFSSAVQYTITAEDGSTKKYNVVVTTFRTWLDSANIHIVGNENGYIYYWKNGYKTSLGKTTAGYGSASAVAVSDTDIYVVGWIGDTSKLWKNGVSTNLSNGSSFSGAKAITVVGNDVYIAGNENYSTVMWKNGVKSVVAIGGPLTYGGMGIGVSGSDVYICGNINEHAYLWKNGVATKLSDSSSSYVSALTISGTDVYITGMENGKAVYWKNGVKTALSTQQSSANDIAVFGADVYIVGSENGFNAIYWKNGVKSIIAPSASANAIKILDNDVYIIGYIGGSFFTTDVCWKNGVVHKISLSPEIDMATGIALGVVVTSR